MTCEHCDYCSDASGRSPMDGEDYGALAFFSSSYCSFPLQPPLAYVSQPKVLVDK
jgi:hypothetical protein